MNFSTNLLPLIAFAGLTTGLCAQDLQSQIGIDPTAGTATYGFSIQGPPNGYCLPIVSLRLNDPLQFPGLLGTLQIDPLFLISLPSFPLSPLGLGQQQFIVPLPIANELPLMFQAAVIDPAHGNQVAFCDVGVAMPRFFQPANPNLPAVAMTTNYNNGQVTVNFATGPAGGNVMILVNGGQKAQGFLILGPNGAGSTSVPVPGGMQRGDTVTVLVNGVPVSNYTH